MSSEQEVIRRARGLVAKIRAEEQRGTPVHPAGRPDCPWTMEDGGYPSEYVALVHALDFPFMEEGPSMIGGVPVISDFLDADFYPQERER